MELYLFGNPTCQPCKAVKLRLTAEGTEHTYIDTFESPDLAGQHMVMSTPTMLIMEDGKEVKRAIGEQNCKALLDTL